MNDELEDYSQKLSQGCFSIDIAFPNLIRQTSFIYLFSVLEKVLMFFVDCAHKNGKLPETPGNHNGKGSSKTNSYLKKVGGVVYPEGGDWNELCLLGELRKRFVHSLNRKPLGLALEACLRKNKAVFKIGVSCRIVLW